MRRRGGGDSVELKRYSPITWAFERAFNLLAYLPPQVIMRLAVGPRSHHIKSADWAADRARQVEWFLITYYILDILAFACTFSSSLALRILATGWATLRIVNIVEASVNVALFDRFRGRQDDRVASRTRLVVLAVVNYIELIVCFAAIYASGFIGHLTNASTSWDALYFSVLTQLTVSFGDVLPSGGIRVAAPIQALGGLLFLVLIFARVISALPELQEIIKKGGNDA